MKQVYTDGGCQPNPGHGAWAFVVVDDGYEACGYCANATNNQMEILAAIKALEYIQGDVTIYSDSSYLVHTMMRKWKRRKNHDLWSALDKLINGRRVIFEHIRGHNGNRYNERCDTLCTLTREKYGSSQT